MTMSNYIVDSYAGVLTKGDILQLFDGLVTTLGGNRSEAARRIDITNKATYDWRDAKYIKFDTKCKVLAATLETNFLETIEFLLNRSGDRTVDILMTVLNTIFNEAMETESKSLFSNLIDKFDTIRRLYRGIVIDRLNDEVSEMLFTLESKANTLGLPFPEKSISDISAQQLIDVLPLLVMEFKRNPGAPEIAASKLRFPVNEVRSLWTSFSDLKVKQKTEWEECFINTVAFEPCPHSEAGQFVISAADSIFLSFHSKNPWETSMFEEAGEARRPQKPLILAR